MEEIFGVAGFLIASSGDSGRNSAGGDTRRRGEISGSCSPDQIPKNFETLDFGDAAILPGLVDSHVHIKRSRTRGMGGVRYGDTRCRCRRIHVSGGHAAELFAGDDHGCRSGGEARGCARRCRVDWAAWGGVVHDNQADIEALAAAGVPGFKCFLIHPESMGFTMVTEQQLRAALPAVARTGLPLLVHAELPGLIDAATEKLMMPIGDAIRSICNRVLRKRSWWQFGCSCRCAASTNLGCTLVHLFGERSFAGVVRRAFSGTEGERRDVPALSASSHLRDN